MAKHDDADYSAARPYVRPDGGTPAILVDIDGTVAHKTDRGIHDYHRVSEDVPDEKVIRLVSMLALLDDGYADIIFLTGRPDRCEPETRMWLDRHFPELKDSYLLLMRKDGDYRPDFVVKQEIFDAHIRDGFDVVAVLDDRDQVVGLWRHMGLLCLQVADGAF